MSGRILHDDGVTNSKEMTDVSVTFSDSRKSLIDVPLIDGFNQEIQVRVSRVGNIKQTYRNLKPQRCE